MAEVVNDLFNGQVEINYVEARPGDYQGKEVSNEKAKKLIGWVPEVDFLEGSKNYYEWYKNNV